MKAPWLAIAALLVAGCSPYHVTSARMGAVYPSKGDACTVQFENVTFQEGSSKYESIGLVSLTGTGSGDEFTDAMKADVQKAACKMGGDAVSLNASAPGMFQFMVWRAR
jgi:hypothetical protein